jgi:hypothetical protein
VNGILEMLAAKVNVTGSKGLHLLWLFHNDGSREQHLVP